MIPHSALDGQATVVATKLDKAEVEPTTFVASDCTTIQGWVVCPLSTMETDYGRRRVVLSTEGTLHRFSEVTPGHGGSKSLIETIPSRDAAEMTGQSYVALYMQLDALLTELAHYQQ